MILLDSDHLTVLRYPEHARCAALSAKLQAASDPVVGTTIVNVEEQKRGWLASIHRVHDAHQQVVLYERLAKMIAFFAPWTIVVFNTLAADTFHRLKSARIRVGTHDLKIASIALVNNALLLTANRRDFERVPGLRFENWLEWQGRSIMVATDVTAALERAAEAIRSADALLIGAGAGMGVDSGLPDFRGPEGFWKAYPPFRGRRFPDISTPASFRSDPEQAWGFYGHTLQMYRAKTPHAGFDSVQRWARAAPHGYFVFTSNVDGHFQRAGFDPQRIFECHGSIHFLQCSLPCGTDLWSADDVPLEVDEEALRARPPLPACPHCGAVARPNVLLFNDTDCVADRSAEQHRRYHAWLRQVTGKNLVAVEMGAGIGMPTVRLECIFHASTLIRINPHDADVPRDGISLPLGALEAITRLDALLQAG